MSIPTRCQQVKKPKSLILKGTQSRSSLIIHHSSFHLAKLWRQSRNIKKTILATEDTEAVGDRNPKGHGNLLCNIGIISWNKNKKLKDCITEYTEFKKNRLSVLSVATNILPDKNSTVRCFRVSFRFGHLNFGHLNSYWPPPPGAFEFRASCFGFKRLHAN
jgi:hypothetical protein